MSKTSWVWDELQGKSPNEIVADFPHLSLADVHAALTYYFDHREEIQRQMREAREFVAAMKASIPSKLPRSAALGMSVHYHLDEHIDPAVAAGNI